MMVEKVSVVVPLRDKVRERVHQLANHQLARLFTESYVTVHKSLPIRPQFPHLVNGDNISLLPQGAVMRVKSGSGGEYWVNPSCVRGERLYIHLVHEGFSASGSTAQPFLLAFTKRHFVILQCKQPQFFTPKGSSPFSSHPGPAFHPPGHRAHGTIGVWFIPGSRELVLLVGPNLMSQPPLTQMRRALILPSGSSDVKLLLLGKSHQQGTCGKGLVSKIWEWLDMETSAHVC